MKILQETLWRWYWLDKMDGPQYLPLLVYSGLAVFFIVLSIKTILHS